MCHLEDEMYPQFEPSYIPDAHLIKELEDIRADGAFFTSLDNDLEVFILRHGQSEGNARNTFQGRYDFPLSVQGEKEARQAGEWLRQFKPDYILASPMLRAKRSAEIVASAINIDHIELDDNLIEVDTGIFSGLNPEIAAQRHPKIWDDFYKRSWDAIPEAESSQSIYARAIMAWQHIREIAARGASRIVCITHGGLLQWLIRSTLGVHDWLPLLPISNCCISKYEIEIIKRNSIAFAQWTLINFHPLESSDRAR